MDYPILPFDPSLQFDSINNQRQYRTSIITRSVRNIQRAWRGFMFRRRIDPAPIDLRRIIRAGPMGNLPSTILTIIWKWVSRLETISARTIIRPPFLNLEAATAPGYIESHRGVLRMVN
tara:strand:- start:632 stop:988 length:357 start_codon:yes stop_codon:yes gene_type:complete